MPDHVARAFISTTSSSQHSTPYGNTRLSGGVWDQTQTQTQSKAYSQPLNRQEFERCRAALKTIFSACSPGDFVVLSTTISAAFNSSRPLHKLELYALIALSLCEVPGFGVLDGVSSDPCCLRGDLSTLLHTLLSAKQYPIGGYDEIEGSTMVVSLFSIDRQGFVSFSDGLMRKFLTAYPIQGLDMSHRTIANACLRQLELDGGFDWQSRLCLTGRDLTGNNNTAAFSGYAQQFWSYHYRHAQGQCPPFSERVHSMLCSSLQGSESAHGDNPWQGLCKHIVDAALQYCTANGFTVLASAYAQLGYNARLVECCRRKEMFNHESKAVTLEKHFAQLGLAPRDNKLDEAATLSASLISNGSARYSRYASEEGWVII